MPLFHENIFWKLNQFAVLATWILLIYCNLNSPNIAYLMILGLFLLSHILQFVFVSRKMPQCNEYTASQIAVLTILLGYSWWVPLHMDKSSKHQTY